VKAGLGKPYLCHPTVNIYPTTRTLMGSGCEEGTKGNKREKMNKKYSKLRDRVERSTLGSAIPRSSND
jgi:hypothetical protein